MYYESTIIDPYHNESYYETHSIAVQARLIQEGPPGMSWVSARKHWSRKATFYSCIDDPQTGVEYIEKLQAFIDQEHHAEVHCKVMSAFRAFDNSMAKKRKVAPV